MGIGNETFSIIPVVTTWQPPLCRCTELNIKHCTMSVTKPFALKWLVVIKNDPVLSQIKRRITKQMNFKKGLQIKQVLVFCQK